MTVSSPVPAPEARCIVCDQPVIDHVKFRYWWRAFWRHRAIAVAGAILGRLPLSLFTDHPEW